MAELRHAVRQLQSAPGFACAVIVIRALTIGANMAMFSLVHAIVLRPLPIDRSDRCWPVSALRYALRRSIQRRRCGQSSERLVAAVPLRICDINAGLLPRTLGFFAALGDLDAVRNALNEDRSGRACMD